MREKLLENFIRKRNRFRAWGFDLQWGNVSLDTTTKRDQGGK